MARSIEDDPDQAFLNRVRQQMLDMLGDELARGKEGYIDVERSYLLTASEYEGEPDEVDAAQKALTDHPFADALKGEEEAAATRTKSRINGAIERSSETVRYPFLEHGPSANWEGGEQWHEGEMIAVPRALVASWTGGFVPATEEAYWTRVQGTSMEPYLQDRDAIFVIICREVKDSARYVIYMDDVAGEVVKRVERLGGGGLLLISDNSAHPRRFLRRIDEGDTDMYEDPEFGLKLRVRVQGRVVYPKDTAQAVVRQIIDALKASR